MASALSQLLNLPPPEEPQQSALSRLLRLPQPVRGAYFTGGPVQKVFDVLRTGEYAVGGALSRQPGESLPGAIGRGIQTREESGPQFARRLQGMGMPDSFVTDATAFAASLVLDPINLVGVGLAGKGLRAVGAVGAAEQLARVGPALTAPLRRAGGAVAERVAPGMVRAAAGRKVVEPILEEMMRAEGVGVERVVSLGKALRKDALRETGRRSAAQGLDKAVGLYSNAATDTMLNHIAQAQQGAEMAAGLARREATRRQALSIGQAARVSAGAVRQTAAASLSGLREAVTGSVGLLSDILKTVGSEAILSVSRAAAKAATVGGRPENVAAAVQLALRGSLRGLSETAQNTVVFQAAESAAQAVARGATARVVEQEVSRTVTAALRQAFKNEADAIVSRISTVAEQTAARGATPRQMEALIAKELRGALEGLGVVKDTQGTILQAFRRAAAPITRGRTQEMASLAAQGVRATLRRTREEAELAERTIGRIPFDPETVTRARQAGLAAQDAWLRSQPDAVQTFVRKWAPQLAIEENRFAEELVLSQMMRPETAAKWKDIHLRRIYQQFEDPQEFVKFLEDTDPAKAAELLGKIERGIPLRRIGAPIPTGIMKQRQILSEEAQAAKGVIQQASSRFIAGGTLAERAIARGRAYQRVAQQFGVADNIRQANPMAFRQMPDTGGWGALAGKWLPKEIADPLLQMVRRPEGIEAFLKSAVGLWKRAKTVWNPAYHFRNLRSNVSLIHNRVGLGGLNPVTWGRAVREVLTNGPALQEAKSVSSAFFETFTKTELGLLVNDIEAARNPVEAVVNAFRKVDAAGTRAQHFEEQMGKMVVYLTERGRGLSPQLSALSAEKALFNYAKVPPWVDNARRWGMYPFITFPYKVATETIPQVLRRPGRFSQQAKLIEAARTEAPEEEAQALPARMRSGGHVRVWNDAHGRPQYYDATYELVFGDIGESGTPVHAIIGLLNGTAPREELLPLLTPLGQLVAEWALNKSGFTGQELRRRGETTLRSGARHVARFVLPGAAFAVGETALAALGAEPEPTSALARAIRGARTRGGVAPLELPQAMAATFLGTRLQPVDVGAEQRFRALDAKRLEEETRAEIHSINRNPNYDPTTKAARRDAVLRRFRQQMNAYRQTGVVPRR